MVMRRISSNAVSWESSFLPIARVITRMNRNITTARMTISIRPPDRSRQDPGGVADVQHWNAFHQQGRGCTTAELLCRLNPGVHGDRQRVSLGRVELPDRVGGGAGLARRHRIQIVEVEEVEVPASPRHGDLAAQTARMLE